MGGYPTPFSPQEIKLIEAGLGYVNRDSGPVQLDETLAHCAISANCREELVAHTQNLSRWTTSNDALGRQWESQFAWGILTTFGGSFTKLNKFLVFHKAFEKIGELKCTVIAVQNMLGEYVATRSSWNSGPCVQVGYHAGTAKEFLDALNQGGGATFFFPDDRCRPDLIFFLLVENGKIIEVHVQCKFTTGTNGAVRSGTWEDAKKSLDLSKTYMKYDSVVRLRCLFVFCPGTLIHDVFFQLLYVGKKICSLEPSWPSNSSRARQDATRDTRRLRTT